MLHETVGAAASSLQDELNIQVPFGSSTDDGDFFVSSRYTLTHLMQTNLEGMPSELSIPAHLVCCQTPQVSHANIFSPSSSLAPQVQSTFHTSVPRSIRNLLSPCFAGHLP
ncbi:hypothetical protein VIGAN_06268400 [Vigna angularis var. angularis]|uniref:Uncharacterized protein n=1 Tax=Vigna angularis var. angularis TaxID=157739 RepID=A0A0S3SEV7_PHAAN|nr:hypothetical protein VIGAN_06268400 [Vigna angularis var. angularis]